MLKANQATFDRFLRVTLGVLLILSGFGLETGGLPVELVGLGVLLTGVTGWCPLYALLHLNTRNAAS